MGLMKAELKVNVGRITGMQEFSYKFLHSEEEKLAKFQKIHKHLNKSPVTAGGKFVYSFNPTGVGTYVYIKCLSCGKEKDITDIKNW